MNVRAGDWVQMRHHPGLQGRVRRVFYERVRLHRIEGGGGGRLTPIVSDRHYADVWVHGDLMMVPVRGVRVIRCAR